MTALVLRGLAARKLRVVLSLLAVLLGAAMIAGTLVQTDRIRAAFDDLFATANQGTDVVLTSRTSFDSQFSEPRPLDAALVEQVRRAPGVARATGQLYASGSLVVHGRYIESRGPTIVTTAVPAPFDPTRLVAGRSPSAPGEIAVNRKLADDEGLHVGDRLGLATATGVQKVRLAGVFDFGRSASLGGATMVVAMLADTQRWFDRAGRVSTVLVAARTGVTPERLARTLHGLLPRQVKVETGAQNAASQADEISGQIGAFLTPLLLALSGAAVLVGAFIIFNTFSITIAQRVREFGLLRTLGTTRAQVLGAVVGEAVVIGVAASLLGLAAGLGVAQGMGALFTAAGVPLPATGLVVSARTVIATFAVGVGVTVISALIPAARATRTPPMEALRAGVVRPVSRGRRRLARALSVLVAVAGAGLLGQGLLGSGPATARVAASASGALLVFLGAALLAKYAVRPLARVIGWPLERLFGAPAELARENAGRDPGRTAMSAASVMVGVSLVVFVAVLAAGLKASITENVTRLIRADLIVANRDVFRPLPERTVAAAASVPGVAAAAGVAFDQIRVNGEKLNVTTDTLEGIEPAQLRQVYSVDWVGGGSDALLAQLRGDAALVEEQFAKAHGISAGDLFRVLTPSGGRARLRALGVYRDPQILQGMIVAPATFRRLSASNDPWLILIAQAPDADATVVRRALERKLAPFPAAKVRANAEYREEVSGQLDQLVYLLYALLGMSVLISLLGIANSLALSIHERTREIGSLRVLGATREQVRAMIGYESVITALIGGVIGIAVGVLFGWLLVLSLRDLGVVMRVPAGQLAISAAVAVVIGVAGALLPARRGARIDLLSALRYE